MPLTYASVAPGVVSPRRPVPASIVRPEYVDRPAPALDTGSEVKDAETIERMRVAGRVAAQAMAAAAAVIAPGVTTDEVDRVGHEFLLDHGAYPSTLGYKGFPKSLCTSVNEVVCHGIPDDRRLQDGDIVNIDITAFIGGVHGGGPDPGASLRDVGPRDVASRVRLRRLGPPSDQLSGTPLDSPAASAQAQLEVAQSSDLPSSHALSSASHFSVRSRAVCSALDASSCESYGPIRSSDWLLLSSLST